MRKLSIALESVLPAKTVPRLQWAAASGSPVVAGTGAVPRHSIVVVASAARSGSMAVCPRPRLGLGIAVAQRLGVGKLRAPHAGRRLALGSGLFGMTLLLL